MSYWEHMEIKIKGLYKMIFSNQYTTTCGNSKFVINKITSNKLVVNEKEIEVELINDSSSNKRIKIGNKTFNFFCKCLNENEYEIWIKHFVLNVKIEDSRSRLLSQYSKADHSNLEEVIIKAPMPGLITTIEVKQGDIVHQGSGLIILEAMKMENEIKSSVNGKIRKIEIIEKTSVEKDQPLLIIEPLN